MTATNNDRRKPGCSAAAGSGCGSIFAGFSKKTSTFMRVVCFIAAAAFLFCFSGCKNNNNDKNGVPNDKTAAVASIGDETVSYALYTAAFDSYLSYMEQMGYDPVSNEEELQKFRDWVLEYLVKDMVVLYRAKEEGFKLSDEQIAESDAQAETELKEIYDEYMKTAKESNAKDDSKTVQQYFDAAIAELSEYYTGKTMTYDEYCEEYKLELRNTALIEAYKDYVCKDFSVTDADIADWYEKQLKSDKELYASNPGQYKDNEEYFEKYCGIYDDAAPALVVPEGYSRIMDIVVIPEGELGDDYKKKNEQLDSLREECTSLLFTDALNGDGANSERIAQLISDYKTLQAECDEMYNKFIEPYRAKIDKAFAELEGGADFAQVMLKYTENEYVAGSDSYGGCETFRTKGQLISTKHSSSKGDWSSTVKEIYSLLKPGEYSDVFTDTDGSLHIIYRGADETPGEVKLADVIDKVTAIVKATSDTEAWDELLDTWMDDADIVYDKDLIASVGKTYVKE